MHKIKVGIVEDDENWLKVLKSYLESYDYINIVGQASNREAAIELVKTTDIDVVLMDINLNSLRCDGIKAVLEILRIKKLIVIMLTSMKDEDVIIDSFTAGAINYVLKENYDQIPLIIKNAYANRYPLEILNKEIFRLRKFEKLNILTPSEREVYDCIEQGYSQVQIEKILYKTKSTIKTQVKSILKKLMSKNMKEAIKKVNNECFMNNLDE